jgi:general secretion pathway protein K
MFLACVVSGVVLLSAVTISFLTSSTTSYRLSRNAVVAARWEAVVEAAIARTVLGLLDTRRERQWRVDGTPQDFSFDGVRVHIAIQDELGRIDLNHADRSLLAGLFQSAGLGIDGAGGLADRILDWRGSGSGSRPSGAQEPDYHAAGLGHGPRNGPFQSVDELKLVMGVTPELYHRVEPTLTVYSGRRFLDPKFAPAEALAALPGQSREAAAAVIASRRSQGTRAGIIDPIVPLGGRAFSIRLEIERPAGALTREVVIRLTDRSSEPHWLLSWRTK